VDTLSQDQLTVELTYLQVYLDKLYRTANIGPDGNKHFDPGLVSDTGRVDDVLAEFLEEQVNKLDNAEFGWQVLKTFVTKDGTKLSRSIEGVNELLKAQDIDVRRTQIAEAIAFFTRRKILTELQDSPNKFEFTHDSLAVKTFEKFDARELALIEVRNFIAQQYELYRREKKSLLTRTNLAYVGPVLDKISLPDEQLAFVERSKRFVKRQRRGVFAIVAAVIIILSVLSTVSLYQVRKARQAEEMAVAEKEKAAKRLEDFKAAEIRRKQLEVDRELSQARIQFEGGYPDNALVIFDKVLKIDSSQEVRLRIDRLKQEYNR
jgi:hypothetical protein